jgi:hypothetical protein
VFLNVALTVSADEKWKQVPKLLSCANQNKMAAVYELNGCKYVQVVGADGFLVTNEDGQIIFANESG